MFSENKKELSINNVSIDSHQGAVQIVHEDFYSREFTTLPYTIDNEGYVNFRISHEQLNNAVELLSRAVK